MAEDRVDITADASQYFDVLSRAGAAANRFTASGADIGGGFLRSERIVSRAAGQMTRDLLNAGSAGDAVSAALLGIERAGIIGLGAAVTLGVGVAAFQVFKKEIDGTKKASDALTKELNKPLSLQIALSPADIASDIDAVTKSTDELIKRRDSLAQRVLSGFFGAGGGIGPGAGLAQLAGIKSQKELTDLIIAGEKKEFDLADARGDSELRVVRAKEIGLELGKEAGAAAKIEADFAADRSKLLSEGPKTTAEFIAKGLEALERTRAVDLRILEIERARQAIHQTLVGQEARIQVGAAQAAIGTGPEVTQRGQLQSEVALRQQAFKSAVDTFVADTKDVAARNALTQAIAELAISKANLAKFENQTAFNNQQALRAASAETEEVQAEVTGQKFLADIIKERATAEAKIAALLRDQKTELATQAQIQATLRFNAAIGAQVLRTPEQIAADQAAQRQAQFQETIGENFVNMLRQDVAAGAKLDEAQQKILDNANALRDAVPKETDFASLKDLGGSDFSSLHSLADSDFSGVASLAHMDFSGVAPLDGLSISIA